MKRLLIDARMIHGVPHGIAKFVEGLALGLSEKKLNYEPVFLVSSFTPSSSPVFGFKTIQAHSRFLSPAEWIEIPRILKSGSFDGFHSPSLSAFPYIPTPYLVTIHDLNHLHFGNSVQKIYYQTLLKFFARHAFQVTTVSEFSKQEISAWLGKTERPIEIIWNVMEPIDNQKFSRPITAPKEGYFLCFEAQKRHKNFETLKRAYEMYSAQVTAPLPLITEIPKDASTAEVMSWMHFAKGCFFPALYEGFGRAPVEATIAGAKIGVSDILPHREGLSGVQSSSVTWLQPDSVSDWAHALIKLHSDTESRALLADALMLSQKFSPKAILNQLDPVYQAMLLV